MRSNTWRALFLLSLTLILVSTAMDAQAARRSALAGNQFINDADDMFAFPQLTHQYKNRAIFDLAPGGEDGSGSIVFGDNSVWNFNTGRGMYPNTTSWAWGGTDRMPFFFDESNMMDDYEGKEWWDFGWATHFGDTPFGVRLNWQKDANESYNEGDTEPWQDNSTSLFGLQLGTTLGPVELALEFDTGSYKDKTVTTAPTDMNDYGISLFTLLGRGGFSGGGVDWRYIAAFSTSKADPKAENVASYTNTAFRASIGPVFGTPGEWEVAASLSYDYTKTEEPNFADDNLKDIETDSYFPAYNMAMEYYLNSWFVMRGGVKSYFETDNDEYESPSGNPEKDKDNYFEFMWTLGLGVDKGNWGLDMALEEDNVHSGYVVLNGDQGYLGNDHPIALLSAWLAW